MNRAVSGKLRVWNKTNYYLVVHGSTWEDVQDLIPGYFPMRPRCCSNKWEAFLTARIEKSRGTPAVVTGKLRRI